MAGDSLKVPTLTCESQGQASPLASTKHVPERARFVGAHESKKTISFVGPRSQAQGVREADETTQ